MIVFLCFASNEDSNNNKKVRPKGHYITISSSNATRVFIYVYNVNICLYFNKSLFFQAHLFCWHFILEQTIEPWRLNVEPGITNKKMLVFANAKLFKFTVYALRIIFPPQKWTENWTLAKWIDLLSQKYCVALEEWQIFLILGTANGPQRGWSQSSANNKRFRRQWLWVSRVGPYAFLFRLFSPFFSLLFQGMKHINLNPFSYSHRSIYSILYNTHVPSKPVEI